jgi:TolA-binding protein
MKTNLSNSKNKKVCRLSHNWLIIVTTSIGLTISGCVPPVNHTTGERLGKQEISMNSGKFIPRSSKMKREKTNNNKINSNDESLEYDSNNNDAKAITEFEKKLLGKKQEVNLLYDDSKEEKKLPSLKEQIEKLDQKQIILEESIDGLKENIYEIKEMLGNIDNVQHHPSTGKLQNSKNEKNNAYENTFIIESEEEIDDVLIEKTKEIAKNNTNNNVSNNNHQKNNSHQKAERKDLSQKEIKPKTLAAKHNTNTNTKAKPKPAANNTNNDDSNDNSIESDEKINVVKTNVVNDVNEKEEVASNLISQSTVNFSDVINKIAKKEFNSAIKQINEILKSSKDSYILSNCNYWLGECYFNQKDYAKAISYFKNVLASKSDKKDIAQARIAEAYVRVGKTEEAKTAYQLLLRDYPKSSQIPTARKMLQQL